MGTLARALPCVSAPRVRKELETLSHFFAICSKFKATRDKALFTGERGKKKRPLVVFLLADPRKHNPPGGKRGKETEAGQGKEVRNKDHHAPHPQAVFQPAIP